MNSIIQNNTPEVVTHTFTPKQYSRKQRRHGSFVIKNRINGKFVKMTISEKKISFTDVELKLATYFKYPYLEQIIGTILVNAPNSNMESQLVYKDKNGELKTK